MTSNEPFGGRYTTSSGPAERLTLWLQTDYLLLADRVSRVNPLVADGQPVLGGPAEHVNPLVAYGLLSTLTLWLQTDYLFPAQHVNPLVADGLPVTSSSR